MEKEYLKELEFILSKDFDIIDMQTYTEYLQFKFYDEYDKLLSFFLEELETKAETDNDKYKDFLRLFFKDAYSIALSPRGYERLEKKTKTWISQKTKVLLDVANLIHKDMYFKGIYWTKTEVEAFLEQVKFFLLEEIDEVRIREYQLKCIIENLTNILSEKLWKEANENTNKIYERYKELTTQKENGEIITFSLDIAYTKSREYKAELKYLGNRIEMFEVELQVEISKIESNHNQVLGKKIKKINWKGKQKELAELFIQLQRKGWIESIEVKTIKELFTETNTIEQVLKPIQVKTTYEPTYSEVFTKNYKEQFKLINENPNNSI